LTDNLSPYGNSPEREEPRENKADIPPSRENGEGNAREEAPFGNGYPFGNQYPYGGQPPSVISIPTAVSPLTVISLLTAVTLTEKSPPPGIKFPLL